MGIVTYVVYATGRTFGIETGRDEVSAREHYERVKQDSLRACVGSDASAVVECVTEAIEAAQAQSETRQDLYAQKDMAKFAFWMLITSTLTTVITALGVWYVKRTLQQSESTNQAAVEAANAAQKANAIMLSQQRPWLSFGEVSGSVVGHRPYEFSDAHMQFEFDIKIKNAGMHSAQNVRLEWLLTDSNEKDASEAFFEMGIPAKREASGFIAPSITINRTFLVPYRWPISSRISQNKFFWLFVSVSYDFPFTDRRFQTAEVFRLSHNIGGVVKVGISSTPFGHVTHQQIIGVDRSALDGRMT